MHVFMIVFGAVQPSADVSAPERSAIRKCDSPEVLR